jgi:hypothetical protein
MTGSRGPASDEKRSKTAAKLQLFVKQYARKRQRGVEPNDRTYDREVERLVQTMSPVELDALLRDGEDD